MAVIPYATFRDRLRASVWPSPPGESASLRAAHNTMFQEAMYEVAKWVRSLRSNNTSVFPACDTYVQCGVTLMEAPYGRYHRVYTIAGDDDGYDWCDKVFYNQSSYDEVCRWSNLIMADWTPPPNVSMPALQQGIKYSEGVTDSEVGRARAGIYALHRRRLYVVPWLQSNEYVVVEWSGEKRSWADVDVLDETYWTQDVEQAIKAFVKWKHENDFGCMKPQERRAMKQEFDDALAEAIYHDDQRLKINPSPDPDLIGRTSTYEELADDIHY